MYKNPVKYEILNPSKFEIMHEMFMLNRTNYPNIHYIEIIDDVTLRVHIIGSCDDKNTRLHLDNLHPGLNWIFHFSYWL